MISGDVCIDAGACPCDLLHYFIQGAVLHCLFAYTTMCKKGAWVGSSSLILLWAGAVPGLGSSSLILLCAGGMLGLGSSLYITMRRRSALIEICFAHTTMCRRSPEFGSYLLYYHVQEGCLG